MILSAFPSFQSAEKIKAKNAICIAVDTQHSSIDFYTMENWDRNTVSHKRKQYKGALYSPAFFKELTGIVEDFADGSTIKDDAYITVMLPDGAISLNTVNIPNMNRRRNEEALTATINGLYKNLDEITINNFLAAQNKQIATYSLSVINNKLKNDFTEAIKAGGLQPSCITFAANGTANAVSVLCPKLKNNSYLLLDIKHHISNFIFVAKGKTSGFYTLPFGYSILTKQRLASEDMLFNHDVAELAVLNAHEKAKSKQLTLMREENLEEDASEEDKLNAKFGDDEDASADPIENAAPVTIKSLPKKTPRKLPKFMIRPQPKNAEEYGYENFRIFVKWALNLLQANDKLLMQGVPENIYVNMPEELEYLYDMVNAEANENGIEFKPLEISSSNEKITSHLEQFGGLYSGNMNRTNIFTC